MTFRAMTGLERGDPLQAQRSHLDRLATLEDGLDDVGREGGERQAPADVALVHAVACDHVPDRGCHPSSEFLGPAMCLGHCRDQPRVRVCGRCPLVGHDELHLGPAPPGHRSGTSVSANRRPPDQLVRPVPTCEGNDGWMAKQGKTRDRPNPGHCPSFELVFVTGRRSFGIHQGQRSTHRSEKAGYMTAGSTAASNPFPLATPGVSISASWMRRFALVCDHKERRLKRHFQQSGSSPRSRTNNAHRNQN